MGSTPKHPRDIHSDPSVTGAGDRPGALHPPHRDTLQGTSDGEGKV